MFLDFQHLVLPLTELPMAYEFIGDSRFEFDRYESFIKVEDERKDDEVRSIPIDSRGCQFPEENNRIWNWKYYSYTACITQCKLESKLKLCNCTDKQVGYHEGKYFPYCIFLCGL